MSSSRIARASALVFSALCAVMAFGQVPSGSNLTRTYTLTNTGTSVAIGELANALRMMTGLFYASADVAEKAITVQGTAEQIALADCVILALDLPGPAAEPAQCTAPAGLSVRVLYARNAQSQQGLLEMLNAARMMSDDQQVSYAMSVKAIAVRGTPEQVAITEWVVQTLDQPGPLPAMSQYPGLEPEQVQIVNLANTQSAQRLMEVLNASRMISGLQRVMAYRDRSAIAVRGSADQTALAYWLMQTLDKPSGWEPASGLAIESYQYPESPLDRIGRSVRIFFLDPAYAQQGNTLMNAIRLATGTQIIMPVSSLPAIVMRGTEEQTSAAEGLLKERISPAAK